MTGGSSPDYGGYSAVPRKLVYDQSVSGHAKLVYMCLGARINASHEAWPSHALIGREAGISVTSVKKGLTELRALGLVTWERRVKPDGSQTSNIYHVKVEMDAERQPKVDPPEGDVPF